ncbi:MAG: prepilin-type N-terminal cleavage/methylation domain-containing protein [Planctomycetaceae bacterium]|jgi:prepilin-type N-terminal cleavage/methylation domain-containing protein
MNRPHNPTWSDQTRLHSRVWRRTGFTLLELLVVVAILVVMAAMVAPNVVNQMQETRVAQAAESVRDVISRSRTFALDAGIDYQFRYEPNGRNFVVIPLELEPVDSNSSAGDSETSSYVRLSGELNEGFRLLAVDDDQQKIESLEAAWFGQLDNALQLSQASWSEPVIFRFDGTADDAAIQVTTDERLAADLSVRGLTGGVSVSRVYREAD